jgi:PAS domain S-box-containing protein
VIVLTTFLWASFREVEGTLLQAGGAGAQSAADQLATVLMQSTQQRLTELSRVAAHPTVRAYVDHPTAETGQAVRAHLAAAVTSPGSQIIELWNDRSERVLSLPIPPSAAPLLPAGTPPTVIGTGAFHLHRDTVFTESFVDIPSGPSVESHVPATARRGVLVVRRPLVANSTRDFLMRLVGHGGAVKIGNAAGDVWTDLSTSVPAPAVDLGHAGVHEYRSANGGRYLGALAEIRGTPWVVWVEFPRAIVLAPAQAFLKRMVVIALVFVVIAGAVVGILIGRMTTPLRALTDASEAIAAGEYARRVMTNRRDEIGRLGAAFNVMTEQVEGAHRALEQRVAQRTGRLAETTSLLERHVQEIKDAREELDRFFSLSLDLLCIAGVDGQFKRVNPAWHDVLGWTLEDLVSVPYLEFVHPDDRGATIQAAAALTEGGRIVSFENRYRCKDGSYRWLNWTSAPLLERGLIYAAARDVTDQKRAALELRDRVAELAIVNQELESFSYSVSHDLRAPLRHVSGFSALLEQTAGPCLDDQGRHYLRTITDAAGRMGRLIDDLLAFSRMGRMALTKRRISLADVVMDARRDVNVDADGREIVWTIHGLPIVDADPAMLRLVVVNLLSNAVKYTRMRSPARIDIGTNTPHNGEVVVFVRDNGVGFDMQYVHKLFGVFQRLHSSDEFEGTGIGLANVRRIVHRHGGRVWADGTIDGGATFYFSLPATV